MKEKVLYITLPKDAIYRRVIVTQDNCVGIVYVEKNTVHTKESKVTIKANIPKPEKLIGGTEVYQKEKIPYWYCKIKNGRDEFMHLYMEDLTEHDLLYDSDGKLRHFSSPNQNDFKKNVLEALKNKPKEGFRWIPVYEPSFDEDKQLQYIKGEMPKVGLNCYRWEKIFQEYSPDNESGMSSPTTYFLLLLRWLKDGFATIEQLADNSSQIGNYWTPKCLEGTFETTGERMFGGLYGFVGNTCKIIGSSKERSFFWLAGGLYNQLGYNYPVSIANRISGPNYKFKNAVGLLELKK